MQDTRRRLLLRVALKLLTFTAVIIIAVALLRGRVEQPAETQAESILRLSLDSLPIGQAQRLQWQGGPLQLLRTGDHTLHLFYDRGGNLGCPLVWQPPGSSNAPQQPWPGGFRDQCNAIWYRYNGQVLPAQSVTSNLSSPPYRINENLLEIGINGDNAAPAVPQ